MITRRMFVTRTAQLAAGSVAGGKLFAGCGKPRPRTPPLPRGSRHLWLIAGTKYFKQLYPGKPMRISTVHPGGGWTKVGELPTGESVFIFGLDG
jgi:hypothetical protein